MKQWQRLVDDYLVRYMVYNCCQNDIWFLNFSVKGLEPLLWFLLSLSNCDHTDHTIIFVGRAVVAVLAHFFESPGKDRSLHFQ